MTFKAPLDLTVHAPDGMYDPANEHDACGVGMVTTLNKRPERKIVTDAIEVLVNLDHRGAVGAEENTGDGAGILMSMPDEFMRATVPAELPEAGHYAAGIAFLDRDIETSGQQEQAIAKIVREEGLEVLAWRVVPTNPDGLGLQALAAMPGFKTLVVASPDGALAGVDLDRKTFRIRKRVEHEVGVYFASLSARTITYKGMLTTMQLTHFFEDLNDERMKATIAIVHSRFSTNTFPSWPLAQPFRLLAHNGEINTIQGNRNWLSAREGRLSSELLGEFEPLLPITTPGYSDSGTFDECLELLHLAGRSLPHAICMMLPPAWEKNPDLDPDVRAFYEYNNTLIEPSSPTAPRSAPCSTATASVPAAGSSPMTATSFWPPRPAFCRRSRRNTSCPRAVLSPARCSWSTPPKAASFPMKRSRGTSLPSTRTASGWKATPLK